MKSKLFALTLASTFGISTIINIPSALAQSRNLYRCIMKNGSPTTVVDTKRGRIDLIVWKSNLFSGWSPLKRCQAITSRFQSFSDQGALRYITNGKMNNQPVICVAQNTPGRGISCRRNGLLITLQPNDNPQKVMNDLFDLSARVRGGSPITRSTENQSILAIDQFLEEVEVSEEIPADNLEVTNTPENPAPITPEITPQSNNIPPNSNASTTATSPIPVMEEPSSSLLPPVDQVSINSPSPATSKNYSCITFNGVPTTAVNTERGLVQVIAWQSNFFQSSGWTPQKRCEEVSKRFNRFEQQGKLNLLTHGKINDLPVICVGERKPGDTACKQDGLLLTLEPKDNPQEVMKQMFTPASDSESQVAVVRSSGNYVINLNEFIQNAPVISPQ